MPRIVVLGAGVIGLSCAVRLLEDGHDAHVFARDLPLETTSATAGAMWYPYLANPPARVARWAAEGYAEFTRLSAVAATGVRLVPGTELHRHKVPDPTWARAVPDLARIDPQRAGFAEGWTFTAPVVQMPVYLRWLAARVQELGGTLTRMTFADFPRPPGILVNATGLGSLGLAGDSSMTAVRGEVVVLEQFGLDRWWLDGDGPTYLIPRESDVVVGGTEEPGEWSTVPRDGVAEDIIGRAVALVPDLERQLRGARVIARKVGRRPARPSVRLERDRDRGTRIVHCYGHGGAGVTLSWGCATEVSRLISDMSA